MDCTDQKCDNVAGITGKNNIAVIGGMNPQDAKKDAKKFNKVLEKWDQGSHNDPEQCHHSHKKGGEASFHVGKKNSWGGKNPMQIGCTISQSLNAMTKNCAESTPLKKAIVWSPAGWGTEGCMAACPEATLTPISGLCDSTTMGETCQDLNKKGRTLGTASYATCPDNGYEPNAEKLVQWMSGEVGAPISSRPGHRRICTAEYTCHTCDKCIEGWRLEGAQPSC